MSLIQYSLSSMSISIETDLRYPVGKFQRPDEITASLLDQWIGDIEALPSKLSSATAGLNEQQLDTPYRPGGWTVRQVVHHLADSHINSYVRYRLALTEECPQIKPYDEAAWARLADAERSPVGSSLQLLQALHARWTILLRSMRAEEFARSFSHPERGPMRLDLNTALYAWHCKHHVAHVLSLRERNQW